MLDLGSLIDCRNISKTLEQKPYNLKSTLFFFANSKVSGKPTYPKPITANFSMANFLRLINVLKLHSEEFH